MVVLLGSKFLYQGRISFRTEGILASLFCFFSFVVSDTEYLYWMIIYSYMSTGHGLYIAQKYKLDLN